MNFLEKLIEPYLSEATPERFEALLLPSILLGYSVMLFYRQEYVLNLDILDKIIQSFLLGFGALMTLRSFIAILWTQKIYGIETDRHTIQISIMISIATIVAVMMKPQV